MDDGDMISKLPHDLLISILSCLTLKEAIVTSVLSRRWEKLWTFYHGNLGFKVYGCSNYARVVNKVLDTLELVEGDGLLDSFTIHCDSCPDKLSSVERWIQFALEKRRVKRLHFLTGCGRGSMAYDFPHLQCFNAQNRNIQALISICFDRVRISGEIIEHFLSFCPLLQSLDLVYSPNPLTHLRVSGETLALRHLGIRHCNHLTTIEISAPNLVSFIYETSGNSFAKFNVRNVPKLESFTFGELKSPLTASALHLLGCFSHLQKLNLGIFSMEPGNFMKLIELTSLKHLTMRFSDNEWQHILAWIPLLKAFPVLQRFTLDIDNVVEATWSAKRPREHDQIPIQCLKEFEFLGFGNSNDDIDVVMYFLKIMVSLEKIILRCDGGAYPIDRHSYKKSLKKAVRIGAKLREIIPKEIKLVFLSPLIRLE